MPKELPGIPTEVAAGLDRLKEELARAAGSNLQGLILYGGLARGRYHPGRSDVNLIVLLGELSTSSLAAVAPALRNARRSIGLDAMLMAKNEVAAIADAFPTKFLDIKNHHLVLLGADPFLDLAVTRERIRLRTAQELRNLQLRLRRRYVDIANDAAMLNRTLARAARSLALQLLTLLQLAGRPIPAEDRTEAIFDASVTAFGLHPEPLAGLAQLRRQPQLIGKLSGLYDGILNSIEEAIATADKLKEAHP
jgi:hypothetical protein